MSSIIVPLGDATAEPHLVGGKGASLIRLVNAGLPVPSGFVVTTDAYREFVTQGRLQDVIEGALTEPPSRAAAVIADAFARQPMPADVAEAVAAALPPTPVVVRSSASQEDAPTTSFAGQHDSFLNVHGSEAVLDAIRRCWASLWTDRAISYRNEARLEHRRVALAVVVQELVRADASGVMFTMNPVTGVRDEVVINATWGLGNVLVDGRVSPDTYVVEHGGAERSRQVSEKAVKEVPDPAGGTRQDPVPALERTATVLESAQVQELARLGEGIEQLYGAPIDVEWTLRDGRFAIVQTRLVTTPEVWNDSLLGDYLWTSGNVGEAVPSVMTPATWSLVSALAPPRLGAHPFSGNIGGRFYLNLSAMLSMADAVGARTTVRRASEQTYGRLPAGMDIPTLPMSRARVLGSAVQLALPMIRDVFTLRLRLPELTASNRERCSRLHAQIMAADAPGALRALWISDVKPLLYDVCPVFDAGARQLSGGRLQRDLVALVGDEDARILLSGMHGTHGALASLGPLLGLAQIKAGSLTREEYVDRWGHRGPDEFEVSVPRPGEDPAWIDRQLAGLVDPQPLLDRQAKERERAWKRLVAARPRAAGRLARRITKAAAQGRAREEARSEFVRAFWVFRRFILRAGELTGAGDDLFFLPIDDVAAVLAGSTQALAAVPARRAAYRQYRNVPPLPTYIRGRFDPASWASDPNRRADVYDETQRVQPRGEAVTGFPGARGVVEGRARVAPTVEHAESLQVGEIIVTQVTNVGWTPHFSRAAAVVTDVGAPLSHAAIVARELGIPAVVGCGDATSRIATGDLLRVDGSAGTVVVLARAGD